MQAKPARGGWGHPNSYASEQKDGHGRTIQTTERFRHNGVMEQRHVRTQYLPTGEPEVITRYRAGSPPVTRWMAYDSHGRMDVNVEPNTTENYVEHGALDLLPAHASTKSWRYAYNSIGELLATSDARGCGQNFHYDQVGRLLAEDYSPCEGHHVNYSPIGNLASPDTASGVEVYYLYDQELGSELPQGCSSSFLQGRTVAVFDKASVTKSVYDGRGRVTESCLRVAAPNAVDSDIGNNRYAPRTYRKAMAYDAADREVAASTGLESAPAGLDPELLGSGGTSQITTTDSARGTVKTVGGSYGSLIVNIRRTADGLMKQMTYGDAAATTTAYSYDQRRRLSSVQTYRGPPGSGIWDNPSAYSSTAYDPNEPTLQLLLQDEDFLYDVVGNPVEIRDWRNPDEWPDGAKPVTKKIQYDDLYRATRVDYQYIGGDDDWTSPFEYENAGGSDPRRAAPAPHVEFDKRMLRQTFRYDWLGNNELSDDDAHGFYDRSLGAIVNGADKAYQLESAAQSVAGGTHNGQLGTTYDAAGNLTELRVSREGACLPSGASCDQVFDYEWDEVGRLVRSRRWDVADAMTATPADGTEAADLRHYYDASDQRVIKRATAGAEDRYTLYLFDTLELRRAQWGNFGEAGLNDYEYTEDTAVPYLLANGVRLARVMYEIAPLPEVDGNSVHVFFELGDHLGSTSVVLDQETGELVERSTFQAYGGAESDYRPSRWAGFREDYRFTGKEEDVEVGLQYFGKRFLNPLLGRWVSADPLTVHGLGADLNVYAYVNGAVLRNLDPIGLCPDTGAGGCASEQAPGPETGAEGASGSAPQDISTGHEGGWDSPIAQAKISAADLARIEAQLKEGGNKGAAATIGYGVGHAASQTPLGIPASWLTSYMVDEFGPDWAKGPFGAGMVLGGLAGAAQGGGEAGAGLAIAAEPTPTGELLMVQGTLKAANGLGVAAIGAAMMMKNSDDPAQSAGEKQSKPAEGPSESLVYKPTAKHQQGGHGTLMDLSDDAAQAALNRSVQGGKQRYAVENGRVYEFQPDNAGTWHGYPVPGNQAPTSVLRTFRETGQITKAQYGKMVKGQQ